MGGDWKKFANIKFIDYTKDIRYISKINSIAAVDENSKHSWLTFKNKKHKYANFWLFS